jgi:hypothetical protein
MDKSGNGIFDGSGKKVLGLGLLFVALVFSSCNTSSGSSAKTGDDASSEDSTNKEVLKSLGLTLDESTPKTGKGDEVSGAVNPLGKKISKFFTRYEVSQIGASIGSLGRYFVADSDTGGSLTKLSQYSTTETGADAAWLSLPKKSVSGDIDGDGKDEVVTAVFNGPEKVITFRWAGADGVLHSKNLEGQTYMDDFGARTWVTDNYFMRDFAAGDFNNDGYCEFAISCMDEVLILDHDLNVVGSFAVENAGTDPMIRIAIGDLNGDDYADLVVINGRRVGNKGTSNYYIFQGGADGLGIPVGASGLDNYAELKGTLSGKSVNFCSGEAAIADYNGDGLNEIVFAGIQANTGFDDDYWDASFNGFAKLHPYMTIWDPYNETTKSWIMSYPVSDHDFGQVDSNGGIHPRNLYVPRVAVGRFDGGTKDMFNVMDLIFYVNDKSEFVVFDKGPYTSSDKSFHRMAYDLAVAGDVNGDGCADLVYFTFSETPWASAVPVHNEGLNVIGSLSVWGKTTGGTYAVLQTTSISSSSQCPTLALADVDTDSLTVEYDHHDLIFSDPKILAVLASPPYYNGMDLSNSATSYTLSSQTDTTNGGHIGFYVGAAIGVGCEWGDDVSGASAGISIKASIQSDFSWGWGETKSYGTDLTYTVNAGSDQVIFAGFPIDVYVYKILTGPAAFIAKNGPNVTISIPRQPEKNSMELSAYNSTVKGAYKIPASIMNHTIGNPHSYYSLTEKTALQTEGANNGGWLFSEGTLAVTQGSGNTIINTWDSTTKTSTFDFDLTIGVDVEAKAGYLITEYQAGVTGGYSYEFSQTTGTSVSGEVGCITSLADWNKNHFSWGLMMIPKTFGDQKFSFVTYWVE